MNLIEFLLLFALLYLPIRLMHARYVSLRLKIKLSELRDGLIEDAICGKINCDSDAYLAFKNMIEVSKEDAGSFSAWNAIPFFIFIQYRKSIRKKPLLDHQALIASNPNLASKKQQYDSLMTDYIFERHLVAILGFAVLSIIPVAIFQNVKPRIRRWVSSSGSFQTILPRLTPLHS